MAAKLIVNPTSANRREIALSRTTILTIGRDPSNDLVLPDAMVSRRHAVVENRNRQFFLRDCSSANGSVVNGKPVTEQPLRDGDLVAIGSMRLLFRDEVAVEASQGGKVLAHPSAAPLECPSCKAAYRRGDLFCRECGARVAQPSGPPKAVCSACGAAVPLPARFCNSCGETLARDGERLQEPSEPSSVSTSDTRPAGIDVQETPAIGTGALSGPLAMAPQPAPAPAPASLPGLVESEALRPERRRERDRRVAAIARDTLALVPAEPGSRLAAFVVDAVFVLSGQAVLLAPVVWYWWARETPRSPQEVALLPVLASVALLPLALLLGILYHVYFWSVKGATPGKELLELRVTTDDGRTPIPLASALSRALGYLLSAASLGVGFLMIAFGGRGLHDRIAGTRVVRGSRA
jgi:uncharacterized RDD family membrane protein YckC/ribosomal protein L40E